MPMIGIYKITKKENGKSYIGQSNDIERRIKEHQSKRTRPYPIELAIQKYGKDAFTYEVLEECSLEELDEREKYWIAYYNTYKGFGYNCNIGGGTSSGENNGRAKLTEEDVRYIRTAYNNHLRRRDVYELFKDKISFGTFAGVWDGTTWSYIMPEVYTEENKKYYMRQATNGEKSSKAILTNEEVIVLRKRYVNETAKQIYPSVQGKIEYQTLQHILCGHSYSNLPIYLKKEKKWINLEACNDFPL